MKTKIIKGLYIILIICLLIMPLIFIFLPADAFDYGESYCPSKRFLDIECFGCGITRAIQHLIHLEFKTAWEFNKLAFLVFPILSFIWLKYLVLFYKKTKNY